MPIDDMKIVTIGVYGSTEAQFFEKLAAARVELFIDIRQRRGVRGSQYAFVNSERLQNRVKEMGIRYLHVRSLAPTSEIRALQKQADSDSDVGKRDRSALSPKFSSAYGTEIMDKFDLDDFQKLLNGCGVVALFCVEQTPQACHRSIAGTRLATALDAELEHL
jgi:uncharacterized protein (DUF488 family)